MSLLPKAGTSQFDSQFVTLISAEPLIRASEEAERCFLVEFWWTRTDGNNAAVDAGLTRESLTSREHRYLFCFLVLCAEANVTPTFDLAVWFAKDIDPTVTLFAPELEDLISCTDSTPTGLAMYADAVAHYAEQRRRASELSGELSQILGGNSIEKRIASSSRRRTRIRTSRGSKAVYYV